MRTIRVADRFRTNPLSLKPGGSEVQVIYRNSTSRIYDKIKSPVSYVGKIHAKEIQDGIVVKVLRDGEIMDHSSILNKAREKGWV